MIIRTNSGDAELASPFHVFPHYLELPPVKKDYLTGAARFKLRSLHPGDPLSTHVDVRTANATGKLIPFKSAAPIYVVAHATSVMEAPKKTRIVTLPGYALLAAGWREYRKAGGNTSAVITGFLVADTWIQAVRFVNGIAVAGTSRRFESPEDIAILIMECTDTLSPGVRDSEPSVIFVIRLSDSEKAPIPTLEGYNRIVSIESDRVIDGIKPAAEELYKPQKNGVSQTLIVAVSILACITLLSSGIRLNRIAQAWEEEAKVVKNEYEKHRSEMSELMNLMKERDSLLAEKVVNASQTTADVYIVFSRLATVLSEARLTSFSLQDRSFKFTAMADDALTTVTKMRADSFFLDVTLIQASPYPDGGELFSVSGRLTQ